MTTLERINQLSAERTRLYRHAAAEEPACPRRVQRLHEVVRELEELWERRRRERAGRREGVDLLVDRAYARAYGEGYDDPISPSSEGQGSREGAMLAA